MPIVEDFSIVADSTVSSSPLPVLTPPIKRAPRTYGRRREALVEDPDISISSETSTQSRDSVYKTGPLDIDEEIPPSSSFGIDSSLADDESHEESPKDASSPFNFGWKQKMKEMDELSADEGEVADVSRPQAPSPIPQPTFGKPLLLLSVASGSITRLVSPVATQESLAYDVFGSTLPSISCHPTPPPFNESESPSSSPSITAARRRVAKRPAVHDSDSESDTLTKDVRSSSTSPNSVPHPINTPKLHSSPTPPTSDDEMQQQLASKTQPKSKGKAVAISRRSVPPLSFQEEPAGNAGGSDSRTSSIGTRSKKSKIKPPTKKELLETAKTRARFKAEQSITLQKSNNSQRHTMASFFGKLKAGPPKLQAQPSSDPIQPFSSPPAGQAQVTAPRSPTHEPESPEKDNHRSVSSISLRADDSIPAMAESDEEDLPGLGEIRAKEEEARKKQHMLAIALEKKKQFLNHQLSSRRAETDDSDEDLEILPSHGGNPAVKEQLQFRKAGVKKRLSESQKRQITHGGISLVKYAAKVSVSPVAKDGASRSDFGSLLGSAQKGRLKKESGLTQGQLNELLARRVNEENKQMTKKKEEEWVRRGGKINNAASKVEGASAEGAWEEYADMGLRMKDVGEEEEDAEEDESDGDYVPDMRGSASPSPDRDEQLAQEEHSMAVDETEDGEVSDDSLDSKGAGIRAPRRRQAIIDSDDSDGENTRPSHQRNTVKPGSKRFEDSDSELSPPIHLPSLTHRHSTSSTDEPVDDENDKENNTHLMFDRSEDKENKAVVRHDLFGTGRRITNSLFNVDSESENQPMSPDLDVRVANDNTDNDKEPEDSENRKPLKDLISDISPQASHLKPTNLTQTFAKQLQHASPSTSTRPPQLSATPSLTPFIGSSDINNAPGGFTQFSEEESTLDFGAPSSLQPGFSDLFEAGTEKQKSPMKTPLGLAAAFTEQPISVLDNLRKPVRSDTFGLTQDVSLQPAFEVGENLMRKADAVFEKEQEYLLEVANQKPQKKAELYVNDLGFLTQTRPDVSTPEVYKRPSQSQSLYGALPTPMSSDTTQRAPLRTLSLSGSTEFGSPENTSLRRLRKRSDSPSSETIDAVLRPSPTIDRNASNRPRNAFSELAQGAALAKHEHKKRTPLERSEFVESEALESDDDDGFEFMKKKDDDEDEGDGEDLDKTLETLVDDQAMNEETVAPHLIYEKYQEQAQEDDVQVEKMHQAVVRGEARMKRRHNGVGLEDSDDDSDEDEKNKRIRRSMNKKQKIDRDDIKALANNEETRPFFQAYEQGVTDPDDDSFAFLQQTESQQDVIMTNADDEEEEEEGEEGEERALTYDELKVLVRQHAEQEEEEESINLNDVSWVDNNSEDENEVRVKTVAIKKSSLARRKAPDPAEFDVNLEMSKPVIVDERERGRQLSWYKLENRSRNGGAARRTEGAAVTGHLKAGKAKAGGGSIRRGLATSASATSASAGRASGSSRSSKAENSLLAGLDRSSRFG